MSLTTRFRPTRFAPVLAAALALSAGPAAAQEAAQTQAAAAPSAEKILQRAHEASGGPAAAKHENRVQKGTFSVPAQGLSGSFTTYSAPPNHFLNVIELAMMGQMKQGYDGETAWASDAMQGPRVLSGDELDNLLAEQQFDSDLGKVFPNSETLGSETFDGHDCWKVSLGMASGNDAIGWFDKETGLLRGMERTMKSPMGELPVRITIGEYETMHGMKVPTKTTMAVAGMQQVMTVDEVMVNVKDMPSFAPPAEVQALMKDQE